MKELGWTRDHKSYFFKALCIIFCLTNLDTNAQEIEWEQSYGGPLEDFVEEVVVAVDGGLVAVGYVSSPDFYLDLWIIKTTSSGEEVWQHFLGGEALEMGHSIKNTSDGGYIVTGRTNSINGNLDPYNLDSDFWIIKFSEDGVIEWEQTYGGEAADFALDGIQTSDGGYIITGASSSVGGDVTNNHGDNDGWVVKLASDGSIEWEKSLGGSGADQLDKVISSNDGGYVLVGMSKSDDGDLTGNFGESDLWIVKLTSEGEVQWQKSFGGSSWDWANSIQSISSGGVIIVGTTNSIDGDVISNHGGYDVWVLELSDTGGLVWQKTYGGGANDFGKDIQLTLDEGYVLVASANSVDGDMQNPLNMSSGLSNYWVVKISTTGNIVWERLVGGGYFEHPTSIKQTEDGGFIVAGGSESPNGDISSPKGGMDYWLVKIGTIILGTDAITNGSLVLYPNPAINNLNILTEANMLGASYRIYNAVGQLLRSGQINREFSSLDINEFANGSYILHLQNAKETLTVTFMKE